MSSWPLLSLIIWVPVVGAALVLAAGEKRPNLVRWLSLFVSLVTFALSIPLYSHFDLNTAGIQFQELRPWIETFNINYYLGIDGISLPLVLLTTFVIVLILIFTLQPETGFFFIMDIKQIQMGTSSRIITIGR